MNKRISQSSQVVVTALVLALALDPAAAFAFGSSAQGAQGYCAGAPMSSTVGPGQVFRVDPISLRERLASNSLDVLTSLNQVHRSKDNLNLSRANLLPSLDISPAAAFSGVGFFASSIAALLPFLVPDNWFALKASKAQLESDKQAYRLAQLNDYATIYAAYLALLNDQKLEAILKSAVNDWQIIYKITVLQDQLGQAQPGAVDLALSQVRLAQNQLQGTQAMNVKDLAAVRTQLDLDPTQPVEIKDYKVPASQNEHMGVDQAAQYAFQLAPEAAQIRDLLDAAHQGVLSATFSFIESGTLNFAQTGGGTNLSLNHAVISMGLHLGADLGPKISLSKRNVDDLVLREKEIVQELDSTLATALGQLPLQLQQYESAAAAEAALKRNYQTTLGRYRLGQATLTDVINSRVGIVQSSAARLAAETTVALTRVTLHRTFLSDQFAQLPGCVYKEARR